MKLTRSDIIALIALLFTIIASCAAVLVVPEFREFIFNQNPIVSLRSSPAEVLSSEQVKIMIKRYDFYSSEWNNWNKEWSNLSGKGITNKFKNQKGGKVIYDDTTGLFWQQSGSIHLLSLEEAEKYIQQLNYDGFAEFRDWRFPTLEEAMSLVEPKKNDNNMNIDPKFDKLQHAIWTADTLDTTKRTWVVSFDQGSCENYGGSMGRYVRAVRN